AIRTQTPLHATKVAGSFAQPWAMDFLPDGRMLVTEKHAGQLRVVTSDGAISGPLEGVPQVGGGGQGGLRDAPGAPDYTTTSFVYLSYYEPREDGNGLAVARGQLRLDAVPRLEAVEVVFRMQPTIDSDKHAGGRMVFTPDGYLFVTLGDRQTDEGR